MKNIFWKTYQVKFETTDGKLKNIQFFRGFVWDVVKMAIIESTEKSKKENITWCVVEIKKV